jgi:hypothetical protein
VPSTQPAIAGIEIIARYTASTWVGVNPSALSTPMCRNPATTAPLTTFATISTATARPIQPNTIRNGTNVPGSPVAIAFSARYDCSPSSAPAGRPAVTAALPALTCASVPASWKRYSICVAVGFSAVICPGDTQASADWLTE